MLKKLLTVPSHLKFFIGLFWLTSLSLVYSSKQGHQSNGNLIAFFSEFPVYLQDPGKSSDNKAVIIHENLAKKEVDNGHDNTAAQQKDVSFAHIPKKMNNEHDATEQCLNMQWPSLPYKRESDEPKDPKCYLDRGEPPRP